MLIKILQLLFFSVQQQAVGKEELFFKKFGEWEKVSNPQCFLVKIFTRCGNIIPEHVQIN